jgi:hypothetical protein
VHLTGLDLLFWGMGFAANASLLFVLWYRRRARHFPFFTTLITLNVARSVVLFVILHYFTRRTYSYFYWSLTVLDTTVQLAVVYEIASRIFRPLHVWATDLRFSFVYLVLLSIAVALGLSWLASPPAPAWILAFVTRGNLFAAALLSELFVGMMALSIHAGLPWRTHEAKIAEGLGTYSLITVVIEAGHSYFGASREAPAFSVLSHLRMATYLGCVTYWVTHLWREQRPVLQMTEDMRKKLFTLQTQVEYHLRDLRSRDK